MPFTEEVEALSPLETFDSEAFEGQSPDEQSVCNLILAFAVAYNDLRDLSFAAVLLEERKPKDTTIKTRETGSFAALNMALVRAQLGVIYELLVLVQANGTARGHPLFRKVVRALDSRARESWQAIESVADDSPSRSRLRRLLLRYRNNTAFHYDAKGLRQGYLQYQASETPPPRLFVSRGNSMRSTRFFFADAAIQTRMLDIAGANKETFVQERRELVRAINRALSQLVTRFVQVRGFAWSAWERAT